MRMQKAEKGTSSSNKSRDRKQKTAQQGVMNSRKTAAAYFPLAAKENSLLQNRNCFAAAEQ